MTKKTLLAIAVVAVIAILSASWFLTQKEITVESSATHEFTINEPMTRVRKILVRTNAAKKVVAMSDGRLVDQELDDVDFKRGDKLLDGKWKLDGDSKLNVEINDAWLGKVDLQIEQQADVQKEKLLVSNKMVESSGGITKYNSSMSLTPTSGGGDAKFETSLSLEITTKANFFTKSAVERNIKAAAGKALETQEEAFRQIVKDKDGDLLILPEIGDKP